MFENNADQISYKRYFLLTVEIKDYNIKIDGENVFDQSLKNYRSTYDNILKITTGQGGGYTKTCLLYYIIYLKQYYKLTRIDLSKQQT